MRKKLCQLLAAEGLRLDPDEIYINYGRSNPQESGTQYWTAFANDMNTDELIMIFGWDPLTHCARYGIAVGTDGQNGGVWWVNAKYPQEQAA